MSKKTDKKLFNKVKKIITGLIVVFLAWRYYRYLEEKSKLNNTTLIIGSMSCFGVIIVGNFPVSLLKNFKL